MYTGPNITTDGLVLSLDAANSKSYVSGSTTWVDMTGNAFNANLPSLLAFLGDGVKSLDFNGSSNTGSIQHNSVMSLSTTSQRTVQAWVRFDSLPSSPNRMIAFAKLSSAFAFDGYWAGINFDGTAVCATNGTAISKTTLSTLTVPTNSWVLYTFISQITATANTTKVYINDVEYISTAHGSDSYSESNNFTIGYFTPPLAGLGNGAYLDGKLATMSFYNRGLSPTEILQNYNSQKSRFNL